jgi:hypothetical protein
MGKQFGSITQIPTPKITSAPVFTVENVRSIATGPAFGGQQQPLNQYILSNTPKYRMVKRF